MCVYKKHSTLFNGKHFCNKHVFELAFDVHKIQYNKTKEDKLETHAIMMDQLMRHPLLATPSAVAVLPSPSVENPSLASPRLQT